MHKSFLTTGFILGAIAVALGAFAAHAMKGMVSDKAVTTFETGVRYHFYHVFALIVAGMLYRDFNQYWMQLAGSMFIIGIILFSGSLYVLSYCIATVKPNTNWIGILTPFGGLAFILAWIFLIVGIWRK